MKKAIFWDFDGTLVHSNESFLCSLCNALSAYGISLEKNIIKNFLANTCTWNTPEKDYVDMTKAKWWSNLLSEVKTFCINNGADKAAASSVCSAFKNNVINYDYVLYSDAEDVLSHFTALGYKNYLLTNNFPQIVNTVEKFGLDKYFCDYFVSANIGYEKPRPELFEYALGKADFPDVCYMVGDNPIADIMGAQNVGITAILVHRKSESSAADHCCAELSDIIDIIRE